VTDLPTLSLAYHVGCTAQESFPGIRATVQPESEPVGTARRTSSYAKRTRELDKVRWMRLVRCHKVEVLLISVQSLTLHQVSQTSTAPL